MIKEVQEKIRKLKTEKDVCILAHAYQNRDIAEIADFTGDSFQLGKYAQSVENKNILLCGVKFMAETIKILSPEKNVYISNVSATCPMAQQITPGLITQMRNVEPERTVVAYINTTAEIKAVSDVCVTSSTAVKIVKNIPNDKILFVPDSNLGDYVKKSLPQKDIRLVHGGCPVHTSVSVSDVKKTKTLYPDALLLVHPECIPEVVELADYVGSTSGIINFAKQSERKTFIIGTEVSIKDTLQHECPEKHFISLSKNLVCPDMKLTTLGDVLCVLNDIGNSHFYEINIDDDIIEKAGKCIEKMQELSI
ncbi:MAG: quinolinate synthase NadA [Acutalibacteraceae bacterium]